MKIFLLLIIIAGLVSCDPGFDEHIKITNTTEASLTFSLDLKKNIEFDTFSFFLANRLLASTRAFSPIDSSIIVNYTVPTAGILFLHQDGGLGYPNFANTNEGIDLITSKFDTVFLVNKKLLKSIYKPENYTFEDSDKSYSAKSFMEMELFAKDVK